MSLVQRISTFLRSPQGQQLVDRGRRELAKPEQPAEAEAAGRPAVQPPALTPRRRPAPYRPLGSPGDRLRARRRPARPPSPQPSAGRRRRRPTPPRRRRPGSGTGCATTRSTPRSTSPWRRYAGSGRRPAQWAARARAEQPGVPADDAGRPGGPQVRQPGPPLRRGLRRGRAARRGDRRGRAGLDPGPDGAAHRRRVRGRPAAPRPGHRPAGAPAGAQGRRERPAGARGGRRPGTRRGAVRPGRAAPAGQGDAALGVRLAQMAGVRAAKRVVAKVVPGAAIVLGTWANSSATKDLAERVPGRSTATRGAAVAGRRRRLLSAGRPAGARRSAGQAGRQRQVTSASRSWPAALGWNQSSGLTRSRVKRTRCAAPPS